MERILVLLSRPDDERLMEEMFRGSYEFVLNKDLAGDFDLCIVDEGSADQYLGTISERRKASYPVFLPVLLLVSQGNADSFLQLHAGMVDEVLFIPIRKMELELRIDALTRIRRLSIGLKHKSEEQVKTMEAANQAKDAFFSMISHEMRTPLNAILGFGSILEDEIPGDLNSLQHDYIGKILRAADQLLLLINNLLDLARMQAGRFEIQPEETDYPALIGETIEAIGPLFREKGLSVELSIDVPCKVVVDGRRIQQVLTNLLSNSIKFSPKGGRLQIRARLEGNRVVTEVEDQGIGISEEDLKKLFIPFQQINTKITREKTGTGLGLSIAKGIVEAHQGSIGAKSPGRGRGSTFFYSLPIGQNLKKCRQKIEGQQ